MSRLALRALAVAALGAGLSACGASGTHLPNLAGVPLVHGARAVAHVTQCDAGANAYCALEVVVYDPAYPNSTALLTSERHNLHSHGWTGANGPVGPESAADSPGHKLHVTYATAGDELQSIDFGWVTRPNVITHALDESMFDRVPALSLVLEYGSGST